MCRRVDTDPHSASDRGISLIEMVVAVLVLSIGIVAGFQGLAQARKGIGEELPRILAQQAALNRAEELQLFGAAANLPAEVTLGGITWTVTTTQLPTEGGFVEARVKVAASGEPGAIVTVFAPAGPPL